MMLIKSRIYLSFNRYNFSKEQIDIYDALLNTVMHDEKPLTIDNLIAKTFIRKMVKTKAHPSFYEWDMVRGETYPKGLTTLEFAFSTTASFKEVMQFVQLFISHTPEDRSLLAMVYLDEQNHGYTCNGISENIHTVDNATAITSTMTTGKFFQLVSSSNIKTIMQRINNV